MGCRVYTSKSVTAMWYELLDVRSDSKNIFLYDCLPNRRSHFDLVYSAKRVRNCFVFLFSCLRRAKCEKC